MDQTSSAGKLPENDQYGYFSSVNTDIGQALGEHFTMRALMGDPITDIDILEKAETLVFTEQDCVDVKDLFTHKGLNYFAAKYNLNVTMSPLEGYASDILSQLFAAQRFNVGNGPYVPYDVWTVSTSSDKLFNRTASYTAEEEAVKHDDIASQLPRSVGMTPASPITTQDHMTTASIPLLEGDGPFTDSGYASMPFPELLTKEKITGLPEAMDPYAPSHAVEDDAQTEYSAATTIVPDLARESISNVCRDIHSRIGKHMGDQGWASISAIFPSLIKAFAIQLGMGGSSDFDRRIMLFVHQHHQ